MKLHRDEWPVNRTIKAAANSNDGMAPLRRKRAARPVIKMLELIAVKGAEIRELEMELSRKRKAMENLKAKLSSRVNGVEAAQCRSLAPKLKLSGRSHERALSEVLLEILYQSNQPLSATEIATRIQGTSVRNIRWTLRDLAESGELQMHESQGTGALRASRRKFSFRRAPGIPAAGVLEFTQPVAWPGRKS